MPDTEVLFQRLGIALLLGLLVGLQRQRAAPGMPGIRTFPMITVLGTLSAMLATLYGGWILLGNLIAVGAGVVYANFRRYVAKDPDPGTTTDIAALLMFGVGALLLTGPLEVAIAIGGGVAVLLQFKVELHRFVERLGDVDVRAIMQFVLLTCIVLPVLPNRTFGPFDVLNPFETWLIIVLIVGLGLVGYLAHKLIGAKAGIILGGILGGLVSSTATAAGYSRQARTVGGANSASIVILIASSIAFVRVGIAAGVVSPLFLRHAAAPLAILAVLTLLPSVVLWFCNHRRPGETLAPGNPTHLKSAIAFGLMYSAILFALAAARHYLGGQGMVTVALLSGLTDMDAITLSTARMSHTDAVIAREGWRLVVLAGMTNLVAKAALSGAMGGWRMGLRMAGLFALPLAGGGLLVWLWR